MKKKLITKEIVIQALKFFAISGVGWIMDFAIFILLTKVCGWSVLVSNIISSIPAITYVFIVSTKKIFKNAEGSLSLKAKYAIYVAYQIVLVLVVSLAAQGMYNLTLPWFKSWGVDFFTNNLEIFIKMGITAVTMICNFIFMKILIEKINKKKDISNI